MSSRVIVLASACFQEQGRQPSAPRDDRVSWPCATDDQPYPRKVLVGAEWQRLELGWLEEAGAANASLIWMTNEEGRRWEVNPTPAERARVEGRVVEVGSKGVKYGDVMPWGLLVPLRAPLVLVPADPSNVWLRCPSLAAEDVPAGGKPPRATVILTAYPV